MYSQFLSLTAEAGDTAAGAMTDAITTGVTAAVGLVGTAFDAITNNKVLCIMRCSCPCWHEHLPQHEEFRSLNHAAQRGGQKARPFSF